MAAICTDQFTFMDDQLKTDFRDIIHKEIVKSEVVEIKRGCIVKQKSKEPSGSLAANLR